MSLFSVVVCTRDRPEALARALAALDGQSAPGFEVVVVDQSAVQNVALAREAASREHLRVVHDHGKGLSRARNIGVEQTSSSWVAFVDDDCVPAPDWAAELDRAIDEHPEVSYVSGYVGDGRVENEYYVRASVSEVREARVLRGPRVPPAHLGLGVCFAVKRAAVFGLQGFDVRLGPGAKTFPAADDMDFNYRFLRQGGAAFVTPAVRVTHEQWRSDREISALYRGYWRATAGMAMKHARLGDPRGGWWLWGLAARDVAGMAWGASKRRSRQRFRVSGSMLVGTIEGTVAGLRQRW